MAENRSSGSRNIDPGMAGSARQAVTPEVDVYKRPASPRVSSGNLGLSIAVMVLLLLLVIVLMIWL